jgi:hypothetical protein
VALFADLSSDGTPTSEGLVATGIGSSGPQISNSQAYVTKADNELMSCMGDNCSALGPAPSYADAFHVDSASNSVVFEQDGDLFLRAEGDSSPTLVPEAVEEFLLHGDVELPPGSAAYALFRERLIPTLAASDLLT